MKFNKKTFINALWQSCYSKYDIFDTLDFLLRYNKELSYLNQLSFASVEKFKEIHEKHSYNDTDRYLGSRYESLINRLLSKHIKVCARIIIERFALNQKRYANALKEKYYYIYNFIYENKK